VSASVGPDGAARCPWANSTPDYIAYHDEEWGRPIRDDRGLFERLTLEAFQSGLSWLTILRKRPGFRRAFDDFDIATVAAYDESDEARLLADPAIVRNRAKVSAALRNARAALDLPGGLAAFLWSFAPDREGRPAPRTLADVPSKTPESTAMAKALKRSGFVFVGPTTSYAMMQATGMVNDHLADCVVRTTVTTVGRSRRSASRAAGASSSA
jgi:DNA-3-methyladenine glycosylase I